jgi:hypothetical protein
MEKVEKSTICIIYTDAPPHHKYWDGTFYENMRLELVKLGKENFQWLTICKKMRSLNMRAYPVFEKIYSKLLIPFYDSLAYITQGETTVLNGSNIGTTTIGIILSVVGAEFEFDKRCKTFQIADRWELKKFVKENSSKYEKEAKILEPKIKVVKEIKSKSFDLSARFRSSETYRKLVYSIFERILVPERVMAITYNTTLAKLGRDICADTMSELSDHDKLLNQFSLTVSKMPKAVRKILLSRCNLRG